MSWNPFKSWHAREVERVLQRIAKEEERLRRTINWKSAKLLMELGYVWCLSQEEWVSPRDALYYKDDYDPTNAP